MDIWDTDLTQPEQQKGGPRMSMMQAARVDCLMRLPNSKIPQSDICKIQDSLDH